MIKTVKGTGANLSRSSKVVGRDKTPVSYLKSSKIAHNTKVVQEDSKMAKSFEEMKTKVASNYKAWKAKMELESNDYDEVTAVAWVYRVWFE